MLMMVKQLDQKSGAKNQFTPTYPAMLMKTKVDTL